MSNTGDPIENCCLFIHVAITNKRGGGVRILGESSDSRRVITFFKEFLLLLFFSQRLNGYFTVKPVLSGHSKIDKTKVLKTNGSLMKVESIAECSLGAFCNTFDLH